MGPAPSHVGAGLLSPPGLSSSPVDRADEVTCVREEVLLGIRSRRSSIAAGSCTHWQTHGCTPSLSPASREVPSRRLRHMDMCGLSHSTRCVDRASSGRIRTLPSWTSGTLTPTPGTRRSDGPTGRRTRRRPGKARHASRPPRCGPPRAPRCGRARRRWRGGGPPRWRCGPA